MENFPTLSVSARAPCMELNYPPHFRRYIKYIWIICSPAPICADDTALLASSDTLELQTMPNIVEFHTDRDRVKVNPDKSELVNYGHTSPITATLNSQEIEVTNSAKHLGVVPWEKHS